MRHYNMNDLLFDELTAELMEAREEIARLKNNEEFHLAVRSNQRKIIQRLRSAIDALEDKIFYLQ